MSISKAKEREKKDAKSAGDWAGASCFLVSAREISLGHPAMSPRSAAEKTLMFKLAENNRQSEVGRTRLVTFISWTSLHTSLVVKQTNEEEKNYIAIINLRSQIQTKC